MDHIIGEKIRALRTASGYSQSCLASKIDVSKNTVINWEQDKYLPDLISITKLISIFNVTFDYFFDSEKPDTVYPDCSTDAEKETCSRSVVSKIDEAPQNSPLKQTMFFAFFFNFGLLAVLSIIALCDENTRALLYVLGATLLLAAVSAIFVICYLRFNKNKTIIQERKIIVLVCCVGFLEFAASVFSLIVINGALIKLDIFSLVIILAAIFTLPIIICYFASKAILQNK